MNKRDQIQQEIDQLTGSTYGRNSDTMLIRIMKLQKKVNQYTLDGKLINTFYSPYECANKTKLNVNNIKSAIKSNRPHGGFVFLLDGVKFKPVKEKGKTGQTIKPFNLLTKEGEVLMTGYKYKDITEYLGLEYTLQEGTKIWNTMSGRIKTYRKQYLIKPLN